LLECQGCLSAPGRSKHNAAGVILDAVEEGILLFGKSAKCGLDWMQSSSRSQNAIKIGPDADSEVMPATIPI
jgi:hypothetical protein